MINSDTKITSPRFKLIDADYPDIGNQLMICQHALFDMSVEYFDISIHTMLVLDTGSLCDIHKCK